MIEKKSTNINRNFPGVKEHQYYSLDDMRKGDPSGITETDSYSSGKKDGPYTNINKVKGMGHF